MIRQRIETEWFDLNEVEYTLRFPVPRGVGARVTLDPLDAAGSVSLDVNITVGARDVAFSTPKALTSAARSAQITADEMVGADEIVVRVGTVAGGSGRVLARLLFTPDIDEGT